jgi:hypothetical protein
VRNLFCIVVVFALAYGCSAHQPAKEQSELLRDPNCDLVYYMTEACHGIGISEKSESRCEMIAAEVKVFFVEGWESLGEQAHEDARLICLEECKRGIAGREVPSAQEVCQAVAAEQPLS